MDPFLILSCNVLFYAYREASHALLILRLQPAGMRVFILFFNVPVSLCAVAWHQDFVIPDSKSAAFLTSFPWKMISYQGKKTCWNSVEMHWVTNSIEITGTEFSPFHGQPLSSRIRNHLAGKRCCLFFFFSSVLCGQIPHPCAVMTGVDQRPPGLCWLDAARVLRRHHQQTWCQADVCRTSITIEAFF